MQRMINYSSMIRSWNPASASSEWSDLNNIIKIIAYTVHWNQRNCSWSWLHPQHIYSNYDNNMNVHIRTSSDVWFLNETFRAGLILKRIIPRWFTESNMLMMQNLAQPMSRPGNERIKPSKKSAFGLVRIALFDSFESVHLFISNRFFCSIITWTCSLAHS